MLIAVVLAKRSSKTAKESFAVETDDDLQKTSSRLSEEEMLTVLEDAIQETNEELEEEVNKGKKILSRAPTSLLPKREFPHPAISLLRLVHYWEAGFQTGIYFSELDFIEAH